MRNLCFVMIAILLSTSTAFGQLTQREREHDRLVERERQRNRALEASRLYFQSPEGKAVLARKQEAKDRLTLERALKTNSPDPQGKIVKRVKPTVGAELLTSKPETLFSTEQGSWRAKVSDRKGQPTFEGRTKVKVLAVKKGGIQVEVLDGPLAGRKGWIRAGFTLGKLASAR